MFYHPLGSMLRLMLRLMDVCSVLASLDALPEFGHLVWSVMDLMVLLFFLWLLLKTFLGETSVLDGFVSSDAILAPSSQILVPRLENSDSARFNSLFFSEILIEDSNGR